MLINMKQMMKDAVAQNRMIPGFNVFGYEDAKLVIEVAEALNAPAILMTNRDAAEFMPVKYYGVLYGKMAEDSSAKVCIHLDHGHSKEEVVQAIQAGYSSVMFDGSSQPINENIAASKVIGELCSACDVSFEVEVGCVAYNDPDKVVAERLTDVKDIIAMCEGAKVDCIAVAVGNVHKMLEQKAVIDFERLSHIQTSSSVPLVIHGSSGIPDDQIEKMQQYGIGKMNIGTAVRMAFGNTLREFAQENPEVFDRIQLVQKPMEEMRKIIEDKYHKLGW